MFATRSLRFWVALGMVIALAPFVISMAVGFIILERGVIAPIHDVAFRQAQQVAPIQNLQILLQDVLIAVDEFVEDGDPRHVEAARHLRGQVEAGFANLAEKVQSDPAAHSLVLRAQDLWVATSDDSAELLSVMSAPGDQAQAQLMQRFHGDIVATSDQLKVVSEQLAQAIGVDHDAAILNYERSLWLAGIAFIISSVAMLIGVYLIGRIIGLSVDRLVDGASRFAEGDRDHRIAIAVPPELRRVADEFNRMIGRVHQSEEALAHLAHLDSLTGLRNRRSFDAAFGEALSRLARTNEPLGLLVLDIDHFKKINDTFGHSGGDEALRALARTMELHVRPYDQIFRVGGDEFAILLSDTGIDDVRLAAERLRQAAEGLRVPTGGNVVELTISIGLVAATQAAKAEEVVGAADAALYRAKASGRNRVEVGSVLHTVD